LDEPQLLEVGDVAEVPRERAEDRRVDAVQLLVVERLDQQQGALPSLRQAVRDPLLELGLGLGRERDPRTLPR
jgi:hypothetical protein